jgi:hypothetical protein
MMQRFWWGHMAKESKVHWMSWEKMGRSKAIKELGFRGLIMFNKALLAKQGWRLLQNPDSLIAQVLKAKYFPQTSFLDADLGSRPSYMWRSLLSSKDLLKEGLVWRIGDGKKIQIWKDRWLPTPLSFSVQSPPQILPETSSLSMLIDYELQGWNSTLIRAIFHRVEAEVILVIPSSPIFPLDRLAWRGTRNGVFFVRSTYHLGMEIQQCSQGSTSYDVGQNRVWTLIWSLEVPNPVNFHVESM